MDQMVVIDGSRYRREDAERLGLLKAKPSAPNKARPAARNKALSTEPPADRPED